MDGGYVTAVHYAVELSRSLFKQHVQLYHVRVRHRVSEALKVVWTVRRLGVFIRGTDLSDSDGRAAMLKLLPSDLVAKEEVHGPRPGEEAERHRPCGAACPQTIQQSAEKV